MRVGTWRPSEDYSIVQVSTDGDLNQDGSSGNGKKT